MPVFETWERGGVVATRALQSPDKRTGPFSGEAPEPWFCSRVTPGCFVMEKMPREPICAEEFASHIDRILRESTLHGSLTQMQGQMAVQTANAIHTILLKLEKIEKHLAGPGIEIVPDRRKSRRRYTFHDRYENDLRKRPDRRA